VNTRDMSLWRLSARRTYGRRAVLRGGGTVLGAGLAGAFALACGSGEGKPSGSSGGVSTSSGAGQAAATQAAQSQDLGGLIGRTGKDAKGETPVRGGTFVTTLTGNPNTLDPHMTVSINTSTPASAVMSRLFRFKTAWDIATANNKEIEPDLALSVEAADAATWTYKLRPDAKFQNIAPVNGRAVTADDVKATFVRAVAPTSANRGSLLMIDPAKIETPDQQTVVFKLNYPYAPFPKLMASAIFAWVLPREGVDGVYDPAKRMIGSGPFILETYQPDVALTFKRNPDWFEKGRPYVDGVKLAIIPDPAQRMAQFTAGNTDFVAPIQNDLPTVQQQNPKAEIIRNVTNGNGIMYYQLSDPSSIFQDIRLRQAASLAADRKAYGKVYYGDKYVRTFNVNPDYGKWVLGWDELSAETKQWYDFDLQKAKQLMDAAGGAKLSIKMAYPMGNPAEPLLKDQSETIFSMLKALPWNITYTPIDYIKDWQAGGKGYNFGGMPADSMAWWGLAQRTDVDELLYGFWHSKSTGNISKLNDPKYDALIDKARTLINEEERVKAYKEAQKYLLDNVYSLTGMVNGITYNVVQPRVRNYTLGDAFGLAANGWTQLWLAT
jgi:peptide/nickel transport system substrate-binding protein